MTNKKIWYINTSVDDDVDFSDKKFNDIVISILKDPDGWESIDKIRFVFVDDAATFDSIKSKNKIPIRLSNNKTIVNECGFDELEKLSCCNMQTKQVWINFYRWMKGARASKLPLKQYRSYVINHEVGHALGRLHAQCPCENCSAPIMMQHTITIGKCKPNHKPLKYE